MTIASTVRYLVWERDQGICGICMRPVPYDRTMHIDHIVPRMAGGTDLLGNLRPTHAACNQGRPRDAYPRHGVPAPRLTITTSIRLTPTLLAQVKRIARAERRTTNEWLRIVLEDTVERYLAEHPELGESDERSAR